MKATCIDKYGNTQLIRLPYTKKTLLNYTLLELSHQQRFVLMHVLQGVSLRQIGDLMKGIPDDCGHKRTKGVSGFRVAQIRNEALIRLREGLPMRLRVNLTEIETSILRIHNRGERYRKMEANLNHETDAEDYPL